MNRYTHRPSIRSGPVQYTVADGTLTIHRRKTGETRTVALKNITVVRITLIQGQALCTIKAKNDRRVVFSLKFEPQN